MPFRLVHLSGSLAGRESVVDGERDLILGRDPNVAQIVFGSDDRLVSRRHASVHERDGVLVLRDLESSTGTFVDGEDVEEAELLPGDVFELGPGGPRVRVEDANGATSPVEQGTIVVAASQVPKLRAAPSPASSTDPAAPLLPGSRLRLTFKSGPRAGESIEPGGSVIRVGRATGNTVTFLDERRVSAQHAKIVRLPDELVLMDLESTNGTFLNGERVERARLRSGDLVALGPDGPELQVEILAPPEQRDGATVSIPNFAELLGRRSGVVLVREVEIPEGGLTLGRSETAGVPLVSPMISKAHARLVRSGGEIVLEDLGSTNGTYVGGARIERRALLPGDRAFIGPFQLEIAEGRLRILDTRRRAEILARDLTVVADGRRILDRVSVSLGAGSFTAIIGPSGSGKSTLLQALSGARPAREGRVAVNGVDVYAVPDALAGLVGYVPQDDIVHAELTPAECLEYTARLRLPADTQPEERSRRIAEVLATLELTERQHVPIARLSGGQRKRVSIAVELLTEPDVLFLDEPASGLDPGLEESLMLLLRELSFKGKTVVIVTHTLDHIHFCDALVLLVGGALAFSGKPDEGRKHFGVAHLSQLYARLKERSGADWGAAFRGTETGRPSDPPAIAAGPAALPPRPRAGGALRQWGVLTARYYRTLTRDRRNAALLLAQAPLIAILIGLSLLYGGSDISYTKPKNTLLFLLALTAVWFGCSNAARELVKERAIFIRERMVGLRVFPYVVSKLAVLQGLALLQCLALLVILDVWFGIPGRTSLLLGAMLLAASLGLLLGLLISAIASTADRAMTLLPIVLIPQVLFTFPAVQLDMKGPAGHIAHTMPTWWAFDLSRRVALTPDAGQSDEQIDARLAAGGSALLTRERFESMLREGFPMWSYRNTIEITWAASGPERLGQWLPARLGHARAAVVDLLALAGMGTVLLAIAVRRQSRVGKG